MYGFTNWFPRTMSTSPLLGSKPPPLGGAVALLTKVEFSGLSGTSPSAKKLSGTLLAMLVVASVSTIFSILVFLQLVKVVKVKIKL